MDMDYLSVSAYEAANVIKKAKGNCVIRNTILNNSTFIDRIDKKLAIRIINDASKIYYNKDDYVGSLELSFDDDTRIVKLLFGN